MEQEQTSAPVSVFCVRFANSLYYMRQRYYNTEIKRFINQDIVVGSIGNSQSLNRYSYVQGNPVTLTDPFGLSPSAKDIIMGAIHGILDVVGCSPELIGMGANLINAALYAFVDHDYGMAALSLLAGVTFGAAKVVAMGGKFAKAAKTVETVGRFVSNVASFAICTKQAVDVGSEMWQKYYVEGKSLDGGSMMEFLALGLNVAGMAMSGKGMVESGNKICKSIKESGVTNKIAGKITSRSAHNVGNGKTLVTHRGTNESIAKKIEQGYLEANYPNVKNDKLREIVKKLDHNKKAVWVSEGKPTWFNRIFSGMVGKRGEASITFEVESEIIKRPNGKLKRWFGKAQKVIEQDVPIPENAIVKYGGKR
ncbi:MAG: hypothetical protein K2M78_08350 [Lachnospiraceae bacterium]|nr:hypothetical protein [Lachnospiraceae bacterium]